MGAKTGYADAILRCLGLYPGQGAEHYLWCEPDAGVRLLLHAYRDRALATAAADIIRSWKDEEPRALWERLRAEGPARCPPVDPREVARWQVVIGSMWVHKQDGRPLSGWAWCDDKPKPLEHADRLTNAPTLPATIADDAREVDPREVARFGFLGHYSHRQGQPESGFSPHLLREYPKTATNNGNKPRTAAVVADRLRALPQMGAAIADDARKIDPREVARVARIISANRLVNPDPETWQNTGNGGYRHGGAEFCTPIDRLADAMAAVPQVDGAAVVDDARAVDAREVARWAWVAQRAYRQGEPQSGGPVQIGNGGRWAQPLEGSLQDAPTLPATIADDARTVPTPPRLPAGTVAYIDPPYLNTTGYAHAFPRSEWLPVVRRWQAAGALVAVSEAEPIPDLIAEGWHAVEITGERKGQKRTFSKQQREFLTMSEPPRWRPAVQGSLFG